MSPVSLQHNSEEIFRYNRAFYYYKSQREKWITRALEYEMIVHNDMEGTGTQFTAQQIEEIKAKNTISTSINFAIAIIEIFQAFLTSNQPIPEVIPVGNNTKIKAYFNRELIKACLNSNNFAEIQEQDVKDQLIAGRGLILLKPSTFYEYNAFNVIMESLDYRYYYPDPTCKLRSHQDAEMQFICKPMLENRAKKIYNLTDDEVTLATTVPEYGDATIDNPLYNSIEQNGVVESMGQRTVWIQEIFEKVQATLYVLEDGTKTFQKPTPYLNSLGRLSGFVIDEVPRTFVQRSVKIGNYIKDQEILPITIYPIIVSGHTHNRNPYEYGIMHQFIDLQYALNKFVAIIIENGMQSSNSNWTAPKGVISDKVRWQQDSSKPGAVLEWEIDATLPDGGKPVRNLPQNINSTFYTLFGIFKSLIEYVTGALPLLQGNAEGAPETVGATNTLTNFGMMRPKLYARRIDSSNSLLGKCIIQMYQAFAPEENIIRYINNTSAMTEIMTNIKVKLEQTPEGQKYMQTNDPNGKLASIIQQEGQQEAKIMFEDITSGEFDVIFKSTNNLPSTRAQAVEFLKTLLGRMSSDAMSIAVVEALFNLADIAEADEVLRNMNAVQQATSELEQQKEINEELKQKLDETVNKLEQQIFKTKEAEIEAAVKIKTAEVEHVIERLENKADDIDKKKEEAKKKRAVEYS